MSISCFQVQHCKVTLKNNHLVDKQLFRSLCFNLCIIEKNNLFLAWLPGLSANSNENYGRYNFQAFANSSGSFQNISRKFTTLMKICFEVTAEDSVTVIVHIVHLNFSVHRSKLLLCY